MVPGSGGLAGISGEERGRRDPQPRVFICLRPVCFVFLASKRRAQRPSLKRAQDQDSTRGDSGSFQRKDRVSEHKVPLTVPSSPGPWDLQGEVSGHPR